MTLLRLREIAEVNPPVPEFDARSADADVTFVPLEAVWPNGRIDLSRVRPKSEVVNGYARFREGDVLVPKVTPTFQAARSALAVGVPCGVGAATTEVHVVRPRSGADPRFLTYAFHTKDFLDEGVSTFQGVAGLQRVPDLFLRDFRIRRRSVTEQRRIADFLDDQVARIDEIIRLRELQIDARRAHCHSLLAEIFDLDLVKVPLRRVVARWIDYRGATPEKAERGVPLVTAKNIRGGVVTFETAREFIAEDDYRPWMRRGFPQIDDVLLTTEAPLGEVAMIDDDRVALAQRVILLRPAPEVLPRWLYWYLRSPQGQDELWLRATGTTALGIKAERLRDVPIPVPGNTKQQSEALTSVEDLEQTNRALEAEMRAQIDLLQERKRSMITAVVMGETDIVAAPRHGVV